MFRHIVMFRIHDDVNADAFHAAVLALEGLGRETNALSWEVFESLDTRKGRILVEDATFDSPDDFAAFRALPAHTEVQVLMSAISDWWIADRDDSAGYR